MSSSNWQIDIRIHECIRPITRAHDWSYMVKYLDEWPRHAIEEAFWKGPGQYLRWDWEGWGEDYRRIYYCPICGVKLDA